MTSARLTGMLPGAPCAKAGTAVSGRSPTGPGGVFQGCDMPTPAAGCTQGGYEAGER